MMMQVGWEGLSRCTFSPTLGHLSLHELSAQPKASTSLQRAIPSGSTSLNAVMSPLPSPDIHSPQNFHLLSLHVWPLMPTRSMLHQEA